MPGPALVTGATGFAGSHLVEHLLQDATRVAAWANPGGRRPADDAAGRILWNAVDLFDPRALTAALSDLSPSAIYHCAGVAHVGQTWSDPTRALRVNVLGTHRLLDAMIDAGLSCPVLIAGSALVYRQSADALSEDHPLGPSSPYGVSKLAQEMVGAREPRLKVILTRPFNHAGPRQDDAYVTSSFARQIARIETGLQPPVLRVGNLAARRDITDVRDTVRAYRLLVERGQPHRPYNICSGRADAVSDALEMLLGMSSASIDVQPDAERMRPSDNPVVLGDPTRIAAEAGWQPEIPLEQTLRDLLDYWRGETARESRVTRS